MKLHGFNLQAHQNTTSKNVCFFLNFFSAVAKRTKQQNHACSQAIQYYSMCLSINMFSN